MKRTLLALGTIFIGATASAQDCSEIFISEYVEGWSNNKALEIYNPTSATVDLSQYMIVRYSNGATSADQSKAVQLTGTIAPKDVYVAVIEKLDPNGTQQEAPVWDSLQARADGFYCPDYNVSQAMYFNGNDAVVLAKGVITDIQNSQLIDVFGKIGEDPGVAWTTTFPYNTGVGVEVTKDHSLIRKSTILKGETNPTISQFNPLGEYDSIPAVVDINGTLYGNWFSLGTHDCDCNTLGLENNEAQVEVTVAPNPSQGSFKVSNVAEYSTVQIVNSLGQEIVVINNNSEATILFDLSDRRGVYFVKLSGNGKSITRRVIIK